MTVVVRTVSEADLVSAVGVHHVDLIVAVARATEGDLLCTTGEGGVFVAGLVVGEFPQARAVRVHRVDLCIPVPVAGEGDLAVRARKGGPHRLTQRHHY